MHQKNVQTKQAHFLCTISYAPEKWISLEQGGSKCGPRPQCGPQTHFSCPAALDLDCVAHSAKRLDFAFALKRRRFLATLDVPRCGLTCMGVVWSPGPCLSKVLAHLVILCFEKRRPKQNTVARLKSNLLAPKMYWPS